MPKTFDAGPRAEHISTVVTALLAEGGPTSVTLRSVAGRSELSLSSLRHYLGSRQRLMSRSCHLAGMAHARRFSQRMADRGFGGLVAEDGIETAEDRGWLVWAEMGRFDEYLCQHVADIEEREWHLVRLALGRWWRRQPRIDEVEIVVAAVRGLRAARCRPCEPLPVSDAVSALEIVVSRAA